MPRIQFSDVTPPDKKRSIRDVPIPNNGKRRVPIIIRPEEKPPLKKAESVHPEPKAPEISEQKKSDAYEYYYPKESKEPKQSSEHYSVLNKLKKKHWIFGTITALVIAVFIVSMMTVFASATIYITPKSQDVKVDMKISATREAEAGSVRYEVIKLSKSDTVSVPATGEEAAEIKASGKIVIYNNFSTEPQRLIVRTRFESPDGLIYRIPESVVVPGKSVKNGVESPGSIEVTVFADEAGEKYNIKKSDFTIPGFKTDAVRYKALYARSSTEMTGGFIGKRKTVAQADKDAAFKNIDSGLQADLQKDLASKVPEGLSLLPNSITYKSSELPIKEETSSVIIGEEVTAYGILLNTQDLSDQITTEYISKLPEWTNIKPVIKDFSLLNVSGIPDSLETNNKIDLQIAGTAKVWADINTNIISQKLLGAPKKDVAKLIDEFAGISSITSTIRPIWKQSFPKDSFKIHVKTTGN
jgi:hypothetical protein